MSDEAMGDEVYQPPAYDVSAKPDDLDMEDALDEPDADQQLDEGYSPPEKPFAVNQTGTTANEQRAGESLDERLAKEVPDVAPPEGNGIGDLPGGDGEPVDEQAGEDRAGRIVSGDQGFPDHGRNANDVIARDVGIDGGAAGAEEAAVHVVDDENVNDDESPPLP
ncbi:DUF5709 domain-containing protein [Streptomyces purpurogeneiscleroticus]|uniref:DUF5709 domain-containing protein n=1 Tax=Streptomyces purpurogeneiscleroticus TaxID=68259 RepID=UPI001CBBF971|nr:DUF5709 domain-containing protein [Streptomyces purpurogeneiscleroticus]MBZ4020421.1 hypothetical protein [Streptomyces purpurogeneiscleroticus]